MKWNHQRWGTLEDPIHKSHLHGIVGQFGCLKSFQFDQQADPDDEASDRVSGKSAAGTASHEVIARALENPEVRQRVLTGEGVSEASVARVYDEELDLARDGRELVWYGKRDDAGKIRSERVAMVAGLLADLHRYVGHIEMVEAGFIAKVGDYWLSGQTDLVYRNHGAGLGMSDWKSGAQKPHQIQLDHGFESGIYASAVHEGVFVPRGVVTLERVEGDADSPHGAALWCATGPLGVEILGRSRYRTQRTALDEVLKRVGALVEEGAELPDYCRRFGNFPEALHYVHMLDYVPYSRAGTKTASRPEELRFYGLSEEGSVKYVKGDRRGPAWYEMRRSEQDVPRLEHLLRNVVSTVRMGRFFESVGEKCTRCRHAAQCLTAGYAPKGDEKREIDEALKGLNLEELGIVA